jgi:hypothetical protein
LRACWCSIFASMAVLPMLEALFMAAGQDEVQMDLDHLEDILERYCRAGTSSFFPPVT